MSPVSAQLSANTSNFPADPGPTARPNLAVDEPLLWNAPIALIDGFGEIGIFRLDTRRLIGDTQTYPAGSGYRFHAYPGLNRQRLGVLPGTPHRWFFKIGS